MIFWLIRPALWLQDYQSTLPEVEQTIAALEAAQAVDSTAR
jgi:hypothetical protein